ncbi:MAG: hypothetical protein ACUVS4_16365 [Chloroflexaceae bacterium]
MSSDNQSNAQRPEQRRPGGGRRIERTTGKNQLLRWGLALLVGLVVLLLLWLLLSGLGVIRLPGQGVDLAPTRVLLAGDPLPVQAVPVGLEPASQEINAGVPPVGALAYVPPEVSPRFAEYYELMGGVRIFGLPLAAPELVNGREVQWFERARLEHWPEFAGTPFEIQPGLIGREFTKGRSFARQTFFVGTPEVRFVPETGHSLGGRFLQFWELYGGLRVFGYPISEEFDEVLPDGRTYRVQYFERARMEYHPELAGTPDEVQLGLLGLALYRGEPRPTTVQPVPTPLPLP